MQTDKFKLVDEINLLAIDYGTKNVGLAMFCCGKDTIPSAYQTLDFESNKRLIVELIRIVKREEIAIVVLGVPLLLDGQETSMTKKVLEFSRSLKKELSKYNVELALQDETLSSFEAKDRMKNSPLFNFKVNEKKIDELAAAIILESFLKKNPPCK
ncbi:MAG: Holliday junction resolvase RuvX [Oligoflexia bacterium]|nr:Holliday junction resolvase RuvX [Oligoflexia bacterium]